MEVADKIKIPRVYIHNVCLARTCKENHEGKPGCPPLQSPQNGEEALQKGKQSCQQVNTTYDQISQTSSQIS